MKTAKDYGISDATLDSMKKFFLKTSIPRILENKKREELKGAKENEHKSKSMEQSDITTKTGIT